ncbi:glycosyltransferase [Gracilibacillus sp. HCP3S3_G5_1]|uniref:glycosyltransferase n=1 Tax=unclassified Gracilibacillus TaxID=2625209 RepID=UPI003F8C7EF2
MKILYKNAGFGGGAPKSLLQYVKISKKHDIDVVVLGQFTYEPVEYKQNNIKLVELPNFHIKKPFKSFIILLKYLNIIKKEKPDIIHTTTLMNCYFHKIISTLINIPIIYNIPGGKIDKFSAQLLEDEKLLVYSEENKLELSKYGYDTNKITVISNRMDTNISIDEYSQHYKYITKNDTEIKLLMISRMSDHHIKSLRYIIKMAEKLYKNNLNVKLDILGDGKHYKNISNLANELNEKYNKNFIIIHGFKNNVLDYIKESHIVFGKGRSVIDGILNCRICFVVSEMNTISHCNLRTFENLRTYNFSGRNLEDIISYDELENCILNLRRGNSNLSYVKKLKQLTQEFYDIKFAENKIIDLYKSTQPTAPNYNPKLFKIIREYIQFYINAIRIKVKQDNDVSRKR